MTICTHTTECGPLGEVELTISYKHHKAHSGRGIEPDEGETVTIYWIKIGGASGVEVDVADDYINNEIRPACLEDWHEGAFIAADAKAKEMREERKAA